MHLEHRYLEQPIEDVNPEELSLAQLGAIEPSMAHVALNSFRGVGGAVKSPNFFKPPIDRGALKSADRNFYQPHGEPRSLEEAIERLHFPDDPEILNKIVVVFELAAARSSTFAKALAIMNNPQFDKVYIAPVTSLIRRADEEIVIAPSAKSLADPSIQRYFIYMKHTFGVNGEEPFDQISILEDKGISPDNMVGLITIRNYREILNSLKSHGLPIDVFQVLEIQKTILYLTQFFHHYKSRHGAKLIPLVPSMLKDEGAETVFRRIIHGVNHGIDQSRVTVDFPTREQLATMGDRVHWGVAAEQDYFDRAVAEVLDSGALKDRSGAEYLLTPGEEALADSLCSTPFQEFLELTNEYHEPYRRLEGKQKKV